LPPVTRRATGSISGIKSKMALHKTRTVRFTQKELDRIDAFLKQNPFLDFSTVARLAINRFIEYPALEIKAIKRAKTNDKTLGGHYG